MLKKLYIYIKNLFVEKYYYTSDYKHRGFNEKIDVKKVRIQEDYPHRKKKKK